MNSQLTVSIVIPVMNGGRYISQTIKELRTLEAEFEGQIEFIVVNDGSTDDTAFRIKQSTDETGNWHLLENTKNMGKGYSVRKGVLEASGDFVLFVDSDLSYPVDSVREVMDALFKGSSVVIVSRVMDGAVLEVPAEMFGYFYTRHTMSRLLNRMVRTFMISNVSDTQSGLKGFTREAALDIFSKQTLNRFSFDLELLFIAHKRGYAFTELPVYSRYSSEPSTVHFIRDGLEVIRSLFVIRWRNWRGLY